MLATGFEATEYLSNLLVQGRAGRSLAQVWDGEPYAFLGLLVPEFPNFFMLYGPNTNGGLIVSNLERQAEFAVQEIRRLARRGIDTVEVTESATRRYNDWLQRRIAVMAYATGENYYKTASGRVVTQWPDNATMYALLAKVLRPLGRWRVEDGQLQWTGARSVDPDADATFCILNT